MQKNIYTAVLVFVIFFTYSAYAQTVSVGPAQLAPSSPALQPLTLPLVLTRGLSLGSGGHDVVLLQQFLQKQNHFMYPTITGYYGQFTRQAVIDFQRAHGIDQVGIVGPITRAKIAEFTDLVFVTVPPKKYVISNKRKRSSSPVIIPDVPADLIAPTVSFVAESLGDSLYHANETILVEVVSDDNVGVVGTRFMLGENQIGEELTGPDQSGFALVMADLPEGLHDLTVIVRDAAGNEVSSIVSIRIDKTPIIISFVNPPSSVSAGSVLRMRAEYQYLDEHETEESIIFVWNVYREGFPDDALANLHGDENPSSFMLESTEGPPYIFEVYAVDPAGNQSLLLTRTIVVILPDGE